MYIVLKNIERSLLNHTVIIHFISINTI